MEFATRLIKMQQTHTRFGNTERQDYEECKSWQVFMTIAAAVLMDKAGRRILLMVSSITVLFSCNVIMVRIDGLIAI